MDQAKKAGADACVQKGDIVAELHHAIARIQQVVNSRTDGRGVEAKREVEDHICPLALRVYAGGACRGFHEPVSWKVFAIVRHGFKGVS